MSDNQALEILKFTKNLILVTVYQAIQNNPMILFKVDLPAIVPTTKYKLCIEPSDRCVT